MDDRMFRVMILYLWGVLSSISRRFSAFTLVALFASLILPRGLFHDCSSVHAIHSEASDPLTPALSTSCAICSTVVPALHRVELPAIVLNEVDVVPPVAVLVTYCCAPPLPASVGRGPPTSC